jgi:nucleoid-associated protein YgaU
MASDRDNKIISNALKELKNKQKNGGKFQDVHKLDATQNNPENKKTINFKQDYVVFIRKKLYYAATSQGEDSQENYLRIYQINNFEDISTSHNIYSKPSSCTVRLKGGERVICADKKEDDVPSFKELINEWLNIDNSTSIHGDDSWELSDNVEDIEDINFTNQMKAREAKYGWRFAEKSDWEPMDEIMILSKSKQKRKGKKGEYNFVPIFYGYLDSIQKTYQAGKGGLLISLNASDHLKLLQLSYAVNAPVMMPGKMSQALDIRYDTNEFNNIVINDPWHDSKGDKQNEESSETQAGEDFEEYLMQNIFAGEKPHKIIKNLCRQAGIDNKALQKRVEEIETAPFVKKIKDGTGLDLFMGNFKTRLDICSNAAQKLFLEFFADEAGNIVFKAPNYTLGVNRKKNNNIGHDINPEEKYKDNDNNESTSSKKMEFTYEVKEGDTLWDISDKFFGNPFKWKKNIYLPNDELIDDPDLIYPGQKLTIKMDPSKTNSNKNEIIYTVKKGDTLWDISDRFFGDPMLWRERVYKENREVIGNDPNLIKPGDKLILTFNNQGMNLPKQDNSSNDNSNPEIENNDQETEEALAKRYDRLIPKIDSKYIISFTLNDSDSEIYNMCEVQVEPDLINLDNVTTIRRAVPDVESILKFGMRPHPGGVVNTPLISTFIEAEYFGTMLITESLSKRYTGSLTMVEESTIRIGDPIRFHSYDEHPIKESEAFPDEKETSVFYVTGIKRNINPSNVSTMTLTLTAGRTLGKEMINYMRKPLYDMYYDEDVNFILQGMLSDYIKTYKENGDYETYIVKSSDTLSTIIRKKYTKNRQDLTPKEKEELLYAISGLNSDKLGEVGIITNSTFEKAFKVNDEIKLPKLETVKQRTAEKSEENN